jgi:Uri superfamily endonuclease
MVYLNKDHHTIWVGVVVRNVMNQKGEREISKELDSYISYIKQYSFNDCRYIKPLRFDFISTWI